MGNREAECNSALRSHEHEISGLDLIQRFRDNREAYHSPHYNEAMLRREFLDPLFKSLGWPAGLRGFVLASTCASRLVGRLCWQPGLA